MSLLEDKIHVAAIRWVNARARFLLWDNHEDMEDEMVWRRTFQFLIEGSKYANTPVLQYLQQHAPKEIENAKAQVKALAEEWGEDVSADTFKYLEL